MRSFKSLGGHLTSLVTFQESRWARADYMNFDLGITDHTHTPSNYKTRKSSFPACWSFTETTGIIDTGRSSLPQRQCRPAKEII